VSLGDKCFGFECVVYDVVFQAERHCLLLALCTEQDTFAGPDRDNLLDAL
jgi:hypothetical protein